MKTAVTVTPETVMVGVGLLVGGFVIYKASKVASAAAGAVANAVGDGLQAVNPVNPDNVFAQAVNAAGDTIISDTGPGRNADGSWTLGGWVFDVFNPGIAGAVGDITKPVTTGGATGTW